MQKFASPCSKYSKGVSAAYSLKSSPDVKIRNEEMENTMDANSDDGENMSEQLEQMNNLM